MYKKIFLFFILIIITINLQSTKVFGEENNKNVKNIEIAEVVNINELKDNQGNSIFLYGIVDCQAKLTPFCTEN